MQKIQKSIIYPNVGLKDILLAFWRGIQPQKWKLFAVIISVILANIANPDMIAHTGNYEATIKAIEVVDEQIGKIMKVIFERNGTLIITSDHGNAERMFNPLTGEPETQHDLSPIPIHLIAKEYYKPKEITEINQAEKTTIGILADVAPTILELMRIPQPKEMTGQSLLKFLL